jgi:hypothetical protein
MGEHRLRVSENRMLKSLCGPKRETVAGGWRKLHNEEFLNLYSSPSIIRAIKSRNMRWVGHVPRMGEMRIIAYTISVWNLKGRDHSEDLGADGKILLRMN